MNQKRSKGKQTAVALPGMSTYRSGFERSSFVLAEPSMGMDKLQILLALVAPINSSLHTVASSAAGGSR